MQLKRPPELAPKNTKVRKEPSRVETIIKRVIAFLTIPLIVAGLFLYFLYQFADFAKNQDWFYLRPEMPTLVAILIYLASLFFLSFLYLGHVKVAKIFAITFSCLMVGLLVISGALETKRTSPMLDIKENLAIPSSWEPIIDSYDLLDDYENGKSLSPSTGLLPCVAGYLACGSLEMSWEKTSDAEPKPQELTDMLNAAGLENVTVECSYNEDGNAKSGVHSCWASAYMPFEAGKEGYYSVDGFVTESNKGVWQLDVSVITNSE